MIVDFKGSHGRGPKRRRQGESEWKCGRVGESNQIICLTEHKFSLEQVPFPSASPPIRWYNNSLLDNHNALAEPPHPSENDFSQMPISGSDRKIKKLEDKF